MQISILIYLLIGISLAVLSKKDLAEQAENLQSQMALEGQFVPHSLVLSFYYGLAILGWPFFLVVTVHNKK